MKKKLNKKQFRKENFASLCAEISPMTTYEADCWSGVCYSAGCYAMGC